MEQKFSEEEQAQIFARALKLQHKEDFGLTLSQLQDTALEAGIDPRCLTQAIAETKSIAETKAVPKSGPSHASLFQVAGLCAFTLAQVYTVSGQALASQRDFYIPFAVAMMVGATSGGKRKLTGLAAMLGLIGLVTLVTIYFLKITGASISDSFPQYAFTNTTLVQFLMFWLGVFIYELTQWVPRAPVLFRRTTQ